MSMINTAIVEDNPKAASLLKQYIECDSIRVTAVYPDAETALAEIPTLPLPDLLLVDVGLRKMSGIELTGILKAKYPKLEILIQTIFEDEKIIVNAIKAGASGYILKASTREEFIKAVEDITNGGSYLSGSIARTLINEFKTAGSSKGKFTEKEKLTERESAILDKLVMGETYKGIASSFGISIHTVNNHIRHIYEKLQVSSRGEAVAKTLIYPQDAV